VLLALLPGSASGHAGLLRSDPAPGAALGASPTTVRLTFTETPQASLSRVRVLDARGTPVKDAVVEIWQVDARGVYLHTGSDNAGSRDRNFQGYGRFQTGSSGEYRFRTIKPVPYPGRTPHIHFAVTSRGRERLTTQLYVRGEPRNERDGILRSIRDPRQRDSVVVPFAPLAQSRAGELAARFDIVLGVTPQG
jgi:protocatechuate 3,4-dioxygenase beta subunit